ncbi:MAG: (d)CMP kinase [Mycobacteriales bacterium]
MTLASNGSVVAIDGPAGTGKSTVARGVARALGGRYLDTGAMYRAATWAVLESRTDPADGDTVLRIVEKASVELSTDPDREHVMVDGQDVTSAIRTEKVSSAVSAVSSVPGVRRRLIAQQRAIIAAGGSIVVEGRDIGAVVAADAPVKIFLTAAPDIRAARRSQQDRADVARVAEAVRRRDDLDARTNPFTPAPGALTVDTSELTVEQVVESVLAEVRRPREEA